MHSSFWARGLGGRSKALAGAVAAIAALGMALAPSALASGVGHFSQRNLVSDRSGRAELTDPDLVNAWGLAFGPTTPAWVANNGSDNSTLYAGAVGSTPVAKVPLTVSIPGGAPTGAVFNGSPTAFVVHSGTS